MKSSQVCFLYLLFSCQGAKRKERKVPHSLKMAQPPIHLILRNKTEVITQLFSAGAPVVGAKSRPETPSPVDTVVKGGYDASSGISPISVDGRLLAAVCKENVEIYDISDCSAPSLRCTVAQGGVVCCSFSPLGDLLLTWHRKKGEEGVWSLPRARLSSSQ